MITAILLIAIVVCAIGWLGNHIAVTALSLYIRDHADISSEDVSVYTRKAVKKVFKVK